MTELRLVALLAALLMVSGCPTGSISVGDDDVSGDDDDVVGDDDDDVSDDDDTGDDDDDTGGDDDDTGGDDDDATGEFSATSLDWRLDDEIESMVWVSWEQTGTAEIHVEFTFENNEWTSTPTAQSGPGFNERLVVGVPFDMGGEWRLVPAGEDAIEGPAFTTGDVPSGLPVADLEVADESNWLQIGKYLLTSINEYNGDWTGGRYWTFIVDRQGRPVWARYAPSGHWTLFASVAKSGDHILWDEATAWSDWDGGAGSSIHRVYLDEEIEEISTPGLHHAFIEMEDTTLVWGSQYHGGGEALVERGPGETGETILWTCHDDWPGSGWYCESNGIWYQASTDSFLYSFYTNNSMVEVDRSTGESLWWAGEVDDGYDFSPGNSQFSWQHGVSYTNAGTLLLSTEANVGGHTTMLREYDVDHNTETLNEVWNFNAGIYAGTNGDAWRLANDNTLHVVGSASELYEVTMDGDIVWHLDFNGSKLLGRGEFIEDLYALTAPIE